MQTTTQGTGVDWTEIVILLLSEAGIIFLVAKLAFDAYVKRLDQRHELELKRMEMPAEELVKDILDMDLLYDALDRIIQIYKADMALSIKLSNGEYFADKSHRWKYSATVQSGGQGGSNSLRNALQNRPMSDCPKMFTRLESTGYAYETEIKQEKANVLEQRILMAGYRSYLVVSTEDCFNMFLVCWRADHADGVGITEKIAEAVRSELLTVEYQLPKK